MHVLFGVEVRALPRSISQTPSPPSRDPKPHTSPPPFRAAVLLTPPPQQDRSGEENVTSLDGIVKVQEPLSSFLLLEEKEQQFTSERRLKHYKDSSYSLRLWVHLNSLGERPKALDNVSRKWSVHSLESL